MARTLSLLRFIAINLVFASSLFYVFPSWAAEYDEKKEKEVNSFSSTLSALDSDDESDFEGPVEDVEVAKTKESIVEGFMKSYSGGRFLIFALTLADQHPPYHDIYERGSSLTRKPHELEATSKAWFEAEEKESDPLLKAVCRYMGIKVRPLNADYKLLNYYNDHFDLMDHLVTMASSYSDPKTALIIKVMAAFECHELQRNMGSHNKTLIEHNPSIGSNEPLPMALFVRQYQQATRIWADLAQTDDVVTLYSVLQAHPLTHNADYYAAAFGHYSFVIDEHPIFAQSKAKIISGLYTHYFCGYLFSGPMMEEPEVPGKPGLQGLRGVIETSIEASKYFSDLSIATASKDPYQSYQFLFFAADLRKRSLQIMDMRVNSPVNLLSPNDPKIVPVKKEGEGAEENKEEEAEECYAIISNFCTAPEEIAISPEELALIQKEEKDRDVFLKEIYERAIFLFAIYDDVFLHRGKDVSAQFMIDMTDAHRWLGEHSSNEFKKQHKMKAGKYAEKARNLASEYEARNIFLKALRPADSRLLSFIYR
ncbi:MAG: hypothetical protein FJX71_04415 [Alphaproteobacteria bacterium]|nr:hypothetical protein [Alphaproteobacteria bacterium]